MFKIAVEGNSLADLAKKVVMLGRELNALGANEEGEEKSEIHTGELKKKRGRPAKNAKAAAEEEDDETEEQEDEDMEDEDSEDDEGESGDDEESEDETEEESEDEEEEESEGLNEKDLTKLKASLKAYSAKHGKEKAVKVLGKFAKASQDVKPADLPKLLKLLKV